MAVFVQCVIDTDFRPVTGDRRTSNYLESPDYELIVREYGDCRERLGVWTVESADNLAERVREMDLHNNGPTPGVETRDQRAMPTGISLSELE